MRTTRLSVAALWCCAVLAAPATATAADPQPRPYLEGLAFPTNIAFAPDGRLFYTEKETGSVRIVEPGGRLVERPFITLPVIASAERGLLGIALHPDFEREPWVYLYRSDPSDARNRLVRVRADGDRATGEPQVLLDGLSAVAGYHNGGDLAFGADGSLFVALGEAHEPERARVETDLGGKIVRLAPDGSVPPDNPFGPGNPTWTIGHRNSFGLCVDPESGELWETENGPDVDDEVNLIREAADYGWPVVTGDAGDARFEDPVVVFPDPVALTGCAVVDGDLWFGAFDGGLWRLDDGRGEPASVARFPTGVTDVARGPDGRLYVATADAIWTLDSPATPSSDEPPPPTPSDAPTPANDGATDDSGSPGWRPWVAAGAAAVLAGAVVVRVVAGRRLRRDETGEPMS